MKKILALFMTAVLMLCGCSAKELTAQEYYDMGREIFSRYVEQVTGFSAYAVDYESGKEISKSDISAFSKETKAVLDELADLNPPKEYKEQHDKLCNSIKDEKKWVDTAVGYLEGKNTDKELEEAVTDFASVYLETVLAVKSAAE